MISQKVQELKLENKTVYEHSVFNSMIFIGLSLEELHALYGD